MIIVLYALVSLYGQLGVVSWIISIWMMGSLLVFLLGRVLGGDTGFSQVGSLQLLTRHHEKPLLIA